MTGVEGSSIIGQEDMFRDRADNFTKIIDCESHLGTSNLGT